ncbi:Mitogen-activated protein kinase kinase kinase 12 [Eumeta japonica]|uniref:Mitogen-activated protein kinase kinase kinase 12 n=1 Tax=Eumeta variegata TaxID=151549 RepID=A0A4C2A9Q8_EUMVA|nr:Mitogen-activated protein kinase kinase kinase 12 [Eumeta japonica]
MRKNAVLEPGAEDKKDLWLGGLIDCFSSLLNILNCDEMKTPRGNDWLVPLDAITDLAYLGAGAQGIVFRGVLNGEMVAVKKLKDKTETDIKHLHKLNHENIVQFKGVIIHPPVYCVVMEFCQYGPLYDFLHSGVSFTPKQILKWAKEIAYGMTYLHSHKIIHRDLKSPNREWNDVSAIMSFTGTVAWMAPEIIRHEPCSERVDVWSFGVVLWELLTQEAPYKNLEAHSIMWGVGTESLSLPIPSTIPESLQLLMNQCWNRIPRNRPPFKIIAAHLEIAGNELCSIRPEQFGAYQATWRKQVSESMEHINRPLPESVMEAETIFLKREELKHARNIRHVYEQQLHRANELYMEVCAVRLQLEEKEKALADWLHCKNLKYFKRQISTSSEGLMHPVERLSRVLNVAVQEYQPKKKMGNRNNFLKDKPANPEPTQVLVNYIEKKNSLNGQCVTVTVKDEEIACDCNSVDSVDNNNSPKCKSINTILENNGNIEKPEVKLYNAQEYENDANDVFLQDNSPIPKERV